jgi:hypothetical protein
MDREDDETRSSGLDELSRLFAPPPEESERPQREPPESEPTGSEPTVSATERESALIPPPVRAVPTSLGTAVSSGLGSPMTGPPTTGSASTGARAARPPLFSPPPLVPPMAPETSQPLPPVPGAEHEPPAPPVSAAPTASPAPVPAPSAPLTGPPSSIPSTSPTPPAAPAFGGLPIAPPTGSTPVSAAPGTVAPERPTSVFAPEVRRSAPEPAAPATVPAPAEPPTASVSDPVARVSVDAARRAAPPPAAPSSGPTRPAPPAASGASPRSGPPVPLLPGGSPADEVDERQLARATVVEKVLFVLAFLLPPIGLIGSIVAAVRSRRRRGWVIGLVQAGVAVGVVFSVIAAGGAYAEYKVLRQQQAHAQIAHDSAAFCAAFVKDPTLAGADGGWPQPAASVPDSLTAMQGFVDRWAALAKVSPAGIQQGVQSIATTGTEIIGAVKVQRTVDDAQNREQMQSAVGASGVAGWRADYCG